MDTESATTGAANADNAVEADGDAIVADVEVAANVPEEAIVAAVTAIDGELSITVVGDVATAVL
jgi:hypothetical protein